MNKKINACINILSSRTQCLPLCLESLWDKWNYRYNYPVYVHYFDDIYDDENLRKSIILKSKSDIRFISVPYKTPSHVEESEMFYNRKELWYVNTGQFSISRKGYLHMCHFYNNLYKYPNTELHKYDFMLSIDDESMFLKEVPYNFFEVLNNQPNKSGAIKLTDPKFKPPKQGALDTRVGMVEFVKNYITNNNIQPKCEFISTLMNCKEPEKHFHQNLIVADSWVFETKIFESKEWKNWADTVNRSGGIYKYRWGDTELNVLFFLIHYGEMPYDFKTVDEGYHNQGALRHIQDYAPSVKDFKR